MTLEVALSEISEIVKKIHSGIHSDPNRDVN